MTPQKQHLKKRYILALVGLGSIVAVVRNEISSPLHYLGLRPKVVSDVYLPASLDVDTQRRLANSVNLGNGNCQWKPPTYDVPEDVDFYKTFVAGYPSGDKRMAYLQMEALVGYPAKDEWDFAYQGMTNHPFIKGNYPHHEGLWGWGDVADQVILMVPNIRRSMVEYHDILWDLGFATKWEEATVHRDSIYLGDPNVTEFLEWRDSRVLDEIAWYGWYIDYWMEGGLMRDIFTHQITTKEHFDDLLLKPFYNRKDLAIENYVDENTVVVPDYDPHCANGEISGGCVPVSVISADRLRQVQGGPRETDKIASVLMNGNTGNMVIASEAWRCIWRELIQMKKGPRIMTDRPGYARKYVEYNFSMEMILEMMNELDRLIDKYSGEDWDGNQNAEELVGILSEHRGDLQKELDEINRGQRKLKDQDFIGPYERSRRRGLNFQGIDDPSQREAHSRYFMALEQKRFEDRRRELEFAASVVEKRGISGNAGYDLDADFFRKLSDTLSKIRMAETAKEMDRETASVLVDRIRTIARVATVGMKELEEDPEEKMTDAEFFQGLSNTLTEIRSLQEAGSIDEETAASLVERVRMMAAEAMEALNSEQEEPPTPIEQKRRRGVANRRGRPKTATQGQ